MSVSKLANVVDFQQLFESLDPDPRIKGRQFEEICKWFLENDPTRRDLVAKVWLWSEWEHAWGIDAGIDLVVEDVDGHLWAVQSKAYDPAYSVSKADVDKFLSESSRKQFSYRLLIATTDKLHHIARKTINAQEKHVGFIGRADLLTAALDWPKSPAVLRPTKPRKPAKPHDYQRDAIKDVVTGFTTADRGQLIMACGTGKTLTSLFIKERLAAERTLVLLPSLSLLKQTMSEWKANATKPFRALPVCSDESVTDSQDEPVAHTSELGLPDVTTDPAAIAEFLRRPGPRVLFSTYQSSPQIAAAFKLGDVPEFDLAFADEAHRVAGDESTAFATILDANAIKAKRRLFMTATPRYYTGHVLKKAQESELVVASMDDHTKFGEVFHRLSFGEAISLGRLTDYQVAVIAVDTADETYREMAENGALLKRDGKKTDGHILASQIGLAKAMRKYDLRRLISFHSTIARARGFAGEMEDVIRWMPKRQRPSGSLWTGTATGEMTAGERHVRLQRLRNLEDGERGLLTNARCLSEGVDVPTLDGVAFIDPKGSEVDIIQAVGRAIRLADDKTIGTIVIPVYIDSTMDPDAALNDSSFKAVWRVVKALRAHDEELAEQIDSIRREMGRGGKPRVPDKIRLDVTKDVSKAFSDAFDVILVEKTSTPWEFMFGLMERYVKENGRAEVRSDCKIGVHFLGKWVTHQRSAYSRGSLSAERTQRLEALPGWSWNPVGDSWKEHYEALTLFAEREGQARPQGGHLEGELRLGQWVSVQRSTRGKMAPERQELLEALPGWSWDVKEDDWSRYHAALTQYAKREGHARPLQTHVENDLKLGVWVSGQRVRNTKDAISDDQKRRLEALPGWSWDPLSDNWAEGFRKLKQHAEECGTAQVHDDYTDPRDGYPIGKFVTQQRMTNRRGKLSQERKERLEALPGWTWDPKKDQWERGFWRLTTYVGLHGSADVLGTYEDPEDGFPLGRWVLKQRNSYSRGRLDQERADRLASIPGWVWDTNDARWDEGFHELAGYAKMTGNTRVHPRQRHGGFPLGQWVTVQRTNYKKGVIPAERQRRLEELPGWSWQPHEDKWERAYALMAEFIEKHGQATVPKSYAKVVGFDLQAWASSQRSDYTAGKLNPERIARLEQLPGWIWGVLSSRWEYGFGKLKEYVVENGDALVPSHYVGEEFDLAAWVGQQRSNYTRGTLSKDYQERLEELPGWVWDKREYNWEESFRLLQAHAAEHGSAAIRRDYVVGGVQLGNWAKEQRRVYASGKLSTERQRRLESLPGWVWDKMGSQWEETFELLKEFAADTGTALVRSDYSVGGVKLGGWVVKQRGDFNAGTLAAGRRERLEALPGWTWDTREARWDESFKLLREYAQEHGTAEVSPDDEGASLVGWVRKQRSRYRSGELSPERQQRLEALPGWVWQATPKVPEWLPRKPEKPARETPDKSPRTVAKVATMPRERSSDTDPESAWGRSLALLKGYTDEHGSAYIPKPYLVESFDLGSWASAQRTAYNKGTLSVTRQQMLETLPGWTWDQKAQRWERMFRLVQDYAAENGTSCVPMDHCAEGQKVGIWVGNQRSFHSRDTLSADRQRRLESLPGWAWRAVGGKSALPWEEAYALLLQYVEEHGHGQAPRSHTINGFDIGGWATKQRSNYREGTLSADRQRLLEELPGWSWEPHSAKWDAGFRHLLDYVAEYGNASVHIKYKSPDGYPLGSWVRNQRAAYGRGELAPSRRERLEKVPGWIWKPPRGPAPKR